MKVAVFGLGYVGSITAAAVARDGHDVVGVDVSSPKIEAMRAGHAPVLEPGLEELVANLVAAGRLRPTSDADEAMRDAEISLICVGTPSKADGTLDLRYVKQVAAQIGVRLKLAAPGHLVVVRSTVLAGSTRTVVIPDIERASGTHIGQGWDVCVNPEFLREGTSLHDYDFPMRVLVGERESGGGSKLLELYKGVTAPVFRTAIEIAEAVKYTDNAFHAVKIAFANEIARVYGSLGLDAAGVMEIVCSDRKLNISPAYLRPGFAFGGSCLPKDLRALIGLARRDGIAVPFLESILPSNEVQIRRAVDAVLATGRRRVALLGLAFKPGTDDLRESPLVELAERLLGKGCELAVHDSSVSLGRLHGSNRAFLEERLPHLNRLLRETVDAAVAISDVVVIGHSDTRFDRADEWRSQGKVVLRLI